MPQLQAAPGQVGDEGPIASLFQLHRHVATLAVPVTPPQGWGGGERSDRWAPWHPAGTGGEGRNGGITHRHRSLAPWQHLEEEHIGKCGGGEPQNLGSVLLLPMGEAGGGRIWQLQGGKEQP